MPRTTKKYIQLFDASTVVALIDREDFVDGRLTAGDFSERKLAVSTSFAPLFAAEAEAPGFGGRPLSL